MHVLTTSVSQTVHPRQYIYLQTVNLTKQSMSCLEVCEQGCVEILVEARVRSGIFQDKFQARMHAVAAPLTRQQAARRHDEVGKHKQNAVAKWTYEQNHLQPSGSTCHAKTSILSTKQQDAVEIGTLGRCTRTSTKVLSILFSEIQVAARTSVESLFRIGACAPMVHLLTKQIGPQCASRTAEHPREIPNPYIAGAGRLETRNPIGICA